MTKSSRQQVHPNMPHAKDDAPDNGERTVSPRHNNDRFDKAKQGIDKLTSKMGVKPASKKKLPARSPSKSKLPASQRRASDTVKNKTLPQRSKTNSGAQNKQRQTKQTANQSTRPAEIVSSIPASDLAEKALILDDSLQYQTDILHDIKVARSNVRHAAERAEAAYALTQNVAIEQDEVVKSFLVDSINATLKHVSGYLELRKSRRLNFLTGEGFKSEKSFGLTPIDFSTHVNLLGEGMAPQVVLKNVNWLKAADKNKSKQKVIGQFSTSAVQSALDLKITHGLKAKAVEDNGYIYSEFLTPNNIDGVFSHFDVSQSNGLHVAEQVNLVDLSQQNNHAIVHYAKTKDDKIGLSVCPINQQRGLVGLNGAPLAVHLEPTPQNRWSEMSDVNVVLGIATDKSIKSKKSLFSLGTQEAGLHLYIENEHINALIWSSKGRQRLALAAKIKPNHYQTIALKFSASNSELSSLRVDGTIGKIIHAHGKFDDLKFDDEKSSTLLNNKLPVLGPSNKIALENFSPKNRFTGVLTEGFVTTSPLSDEDMRLLTNYMTLKWGSVCLSLSVIDLRSQLESIGSAKLCISPTKATKSVISSKRADTPETVKLILHKLIEAAKHLDHQEKLFSDDPECLAQLSSFAGNRNHESHGLETPEQFAELLASSIKINLSHKNLSILERGQTAALSIVQSEQVSRSTAHKSQKNGNDYSDLADKDLLPSMDEICDAVGF